MVTIIRKKALNPAVTLMEVKAPLEAAKAQPGQFVILRVDAEGERIPLTIANYSKERGTITIIFQIVGARTLRLNQLREGDTLHDFVGPLGNPSVCLARKVAVIGGGVGSAIAYPVAKKFFSEGEEVIAIGPLVMMKFVAAVTKPYGIKTTVSMNPIMIDGTGMCGGCRLSVGGKTKFACVDGPDFDGHQVDFNEALARGGIYRPFEAKAHETACELFKAEFRKEAV